MSADSGNPNLVLLGFPALSDVAILDEVAAAGENTNRPGARQDADHEMRCKP
jgi:hypothetical protein